MHTEQQNPNTLHIDQLPIGELLSVMNREDQQVAAAVQAALPAISRAVEVITAKLSRGGRLIYIGAGTSGRLGVLDAVECVPTFSVPPGMVIGLMAGGMGALTQAVEGAEDNGQAGADDLAAVELSSSDVVVGIAASGRTPYVLGAVDYANQLSAATVGISCNVPAPLLDLAQFPIGVTVGPEVITGSTRLKAGTAQKLILNMLSTASMIQLGKVYGNLMVDVQVTNEKLAQRAQRIIMQIAGVDSHLAAQLLKAAENSPKLAIVMYLKGVSAEEGRALLSAAQGRLRDVIG